MQVFHTVEQLCYRQASLYAGEWQVLGLLRLLLLGLWCDACTARHILLGARVAWATMQRVLDIHCSRIHVGLEMKIARQPECADSAT